MANRKAHMEAGCAAGGMTAAWYAREQSLGALLVEVVGGLAGGMLGARLPDVIDPPTSGRHRSVGHGVAPAGGTAWCLLAMLPEWQADTRARADVAYRAFETAASFLDQAWHLLIAALLRLARGGLAGLIAGYLSHLAMDATTPASIPFFA